MKTAKEILYEHAHKNNDGFLTGQVRWLVEAMEEYGRNVFEAARMCEVEQTTGTSQGYEFNNYDDYKNAKQK